MIKLAPAPAPPGFADPQSMFVRERAAAIAFYKVKANRAKSFDYKAYRNKSISETLNAHFGFKCAYCESYFGATEPVDVEHYRPKGVVMEGKRKIKPGYFWLASEWMNLLPSCIDCNRKREHKFTEGPQSTGKAMSFPLADPKKRAKAPGGEKKEEPLLLHPYFDEPGAHLRFVADGFIQPAPDPAGVPSRRGQASIEVLGLHRPGLTFARRNRAVEIEGAIAKIKRYLTNVDESETAKERKKWEGELQVEVGALKQKLGADQIYSGMSRQFAADFLKAFQGGAP